MIMHPVKTEFAGTEAVTAPFDLAICAIADLAAYARTRRLSTADELLLELLAFLFVTQPTSSSEKLVAGGDRAFSDMQSLLQSVPNSDAVFGIENKISPGSLQSQHWSE